MIIASLWMQANWAESLHTPEKNWQSLPDIRKWVQVGSAPQEASGSVAVSTNTLQQLACLESVCSGQTKAPLHTAPSQEKCWGRLPDFQVYRLTDPNRYNTRITISCFCQLHTATSTLFDQGAAQGSAIAFWLVPLWLHAGKAKLLFCPAGPWASEVDPLILLEPLLRSTKQIRPSQKKEAKSKVLIAQFQGQTMAQNRTLTSWLPLVVPNDSAMPLVCECVQSQEKYKTVHKHGLPMTKQRSSLISALSRVLTLSSQSNARFAWEQVARWSFFALRSPQAASGTSTCS